MKIIPPHQTKSRAVVESDYARILKVAPEIQQLCNQKHGRYQGAHAIAHQQVESEDPLCFFVTVDSLVIMNPKIVSSEHTTLHKEGCVSFADREVTKVRRDQKIRVDFEVLLPTGRIQKHGNEEFTGMMAFVFAHEIEHFNCDYIYDL